jgi:hypothetical protein
MIIFGIFRFAHCIAHIARLVINANVWFELNEAINMTNDQDERGGVIGVRIPAELMRRIDSVAATEGISRADVVRRAAKFDVERRTAAVEVSA